MNDAAGPGPDERGPGGGGASQLALGKALAIVVVGLVVGILLLGVAARPPVPIVLSNAATTTTTTLGSVTTTTVAGPTTTTTTIPLSTVKVLVENATSVPGAAGKFAAFLGQLTWSTLTPLNAPKTETTTTIFYAAGFKSAAQSMGVDLGLAHPAITALTTSSPVQGAAGADLVVLLGADLASTTPTTAAPAG